MKAAVYTQYGAPEVLRIEEVKKPVPEKNEILVKINATAVNSGDWRLRKADPFAIRFVFGLFKPKRNILGSVFSGTIDRVGTEVKKFKVGDLIFGHTDMTLGAYAEYMRMPENGSMAIKPANISHTEAATIPFGGVTALHFIKKANIKPGQKVLIVGASGAVGSAAVQLAKAFGAEVTGVCSSTNVALVQSFGADKVVDYTTEDFTNNGITYDVIFDTVKATSFSKNLKSLKPNGTMILSAGGLNEMLRGIWISITSSKKVLTGVINHSAADIIFIKGLVEANKYTAVIDRTYALAQIAQAHAYAEKGHKKGNVAIEI